MTSRTIYALVTVTVFAFISGYALAQSGVTVSLGGKTVSSDVIERDGRAYAPIAEVAKAFDYTVVRTASGYDLVPVGGASAKKESGAKPPAKGLDGEIGETLANGQVTVQVLRVERGTSYVSPITGKKFAAEDDLELVVVACRMRNTLKKLRQYDLGYFKGGNTALTDTNGESFAPKAWDRKEPIVRLPAGGGVDFAVIFAVPKATVLGDFTYAVRPNDFDRTMRQDNFHVSLAVKKDTESTTP